MRCHKYKHCGGSSGQGETGSAGHDRCVLTGVLLPNHGAHLLTHPLHPVHIPGPRKSYPGMVSLDESFHLYSCPGSGLG